MKSKYLLLTLALTLAGFISAQAQNYIAFTGSISNTTGPVTVTIKHSGTSYTLTATNGVFGDSLNVAGAQGILEASITDCNGQTQKDSFAWGPGRMFGQLTLTYCNSTPPPPASCKADYTYAQVRDSAGNAVPYHVLITNKSTGNNLSYSWSFGDGNTSNQAKPNHSYSGSGPYNVCLVITATDSSGQVNCTDSICHTISVDSTGGVRADGKITIWVDDVDFSQIPDGTTGIAAHYADQVNFKVFPNPAEDMVKVSLNMELGENLNLQVIDLTGKIVVSENNDWTGAPVEVNLSELTPGIYFLNAHTANGTASQKIVVQ